MNINKKNKQLFYGTKPTIFGRLCTPLIKKRWIYKQVELNRHTCGAKLSVNLNIINLKIYRYVTKSNLH